MNNRTFPSDNLESEALRPYNLGCPSPFGICLTQQRKCRSVNNGQHPHTTQEISKLLPHADADPVFQPLGTHGSTDWGLGFSLVFSSRTESSSKLLDGSRQRLRATLPLRVCCSVSSSNLGHQYRPEVFRRWSFKLLKGIELAYQNETLLLVWHEPTSNRVIPAIAPGAVDLPSVSMEEVDAIKLFTCCLQRFLISVLIFPNASSSTPSCESWSDTWSTGTRG